jgi:hypothetical protein
MLLAQQVGRARRPAMLILACALLLAGIVTGLLQ